MRLWDTREGGSSGGSRALSCFVGADRSVQSADNHGNVTFAKNGAQSVGIVNGCRKRRERDKRRTSGNDFLDQLAISARGFVVAARPRLRRHTGECQHSQRRKFGKRIGAIAQSRQRHAEFENLFGFNS